jgi:DNA (cytosine-5)-methyltransferase 1
VPQWRERAIIVAVRRDLKATWTMPAATHSLEALLWSKWQTGDYWRDHSIAPKKKFLVSKRFQSPFARLKESRVADVTLPRWRTVRDATASLPRLRQGQRAEDDPDHFLNPGARAYDKHTGSLPDEPAKTLKAGSHGVPGGENTLYLGRGRVRYFSIRECARLQTFPDEYKFPTTWTRGMRQVGNAVPVALAEVVGRSIAQMLHKTAPAPRAK